MPRSASAGPSSRRATRFKAPRRSPAASARAAAVIIEFHRNPVTLVTPTIRCRDPSLRHDHATRSRHWTNTRRRKCDAQQDPGKQERRKQKSPETERTSGQLAMNAPPIVSPQEWQAAREQMLVKEKAFARSRDALAAERRRMPWMAVEKAYEFEGPEGKDEPARPVRGPPPADRLPRLFRAWGVRVARACLPRLLPGADQVSNLAHLNARDTTLVYASRAPQADIARLKARMGWEMPWYTLDGQLRRRLRRGRVARPQRVLSATAIRCSAPTSSIPAVTRRWGPPGATSTRLRSDARRRGRRLPGGLPADAAVPVVEMARRIRRRGRTRPEVDRGVGGRTSGVEGSREILGARPAGGKQ